MLYIRGLRRKNPYDLVDTLTQGVLVRLNPEEVLIKKYSNLNIFLYIFV